MKKNQIEEGGRGKKKKEKEKKKVWKKEKNLKEVLDSDSS